MGLLAPNNVNGAMEVPVYKIFLALLLDNGRKTRCIVHPSKLWLFLSNNKQQQSLFFFHNTGFILSTQSQWHVADLSYINKSLTLLFKYEWKVYFSNLPCDRVSRSIF